MFLIVTAFYRVFQQEFEEKMILDAGASRVIDNVSGPSPMKLTKGFATFRRASL